jgi:hypothetical protein
MDAFGPWRSLASALAWGARGPGFKSRRPDQIAQFDGSDLRQQWGHPRHELFTSKTRISSFSCNASSSVVTACRRLSKSVIVYVYADGVSPLVRW